MSRAVIIDHTYRLQAADIGQQFMRVQIVSVSLQGLEESKPMLHLAEFPNRPLVLDAVQRDALLRITGSALFNDWVGQTIQLHRAHNGKDVAITALEVRTPPLLRIQHQPLCAGRFALSTGEHFCSSWSSSWSLPPLLC